MGGLDYGSQKRALIRKEYNAIIDILIDIKTSNIANIF